MTTKRALGLMAGGRAGGGTVAANPLTLYQVQDRHDQWGDKDVLPELVTVDWILSASQARLVNRADRRYLHFRSRFARQPDPAQPVIGWYTTPLAAWTAYYTDRVEAIQRYAERAERAKRDADVAAARLQELTTDGRR